MTIQVIPFENLPKLMADLEALALSNNDVVFRGHRDETWKIESTLARYTSIPHQSWDDHIDKMLSHFIVNALSIGTIPFPPADRRSRLEYGRHYGVPTPLIDFSLSPYVALYFAFGEVLYRHNPTASNSAAIYALNMNNLGGCWSKFLNGNFDEEYSKFMYEKTNIFEHGYPAGELKFMRFPASWNQRMQRQLGCFIYDTLDYKKIGFEGFEALIHSFEEPTSNGTRHPTLIKYLIPQSEASGVFSRLELMNINGTKLIDSEGIAADVKSSYNYARKTGYAWDIELSPPDDTKM